MAKEYQKTTGASQGLEESVQQMREKVLESEEAAEDKESTLKEIKLRLQHSKIASVPQTNEHEHETDTALKLIDLYQINFHR